MNKIQEVKANIRYENDKPILDLEYLGVVCGDKLLNCYVSNIDLTECDIDDKYNKHEIYTYPHLSEIKFKYHKDLRFEDITPVKEI